MSLAAITVHYQNPTLTQRLIESLEPCSIVQKIIVISHDSFSIPSQGKVEFCQQPNCGYAAGINRAVEIAIASGIRTVLAANPDVLIDCKTVEALFREHQTASAACTFPVLSENGKMIYGYRFSRFGSLRIVRDGEWYSGACFLLNADTWEKTGGFNEKMFHYFEDRDFCLRVRETGARLQQASNVVVVHQSKSGGNFIQAGLPEFAVRNHLLSLEQSGLLNPISFSNVVFRHFLYLLKWKNWWRGVPRWIRGIQAFLTRNDR